MPTHDASSSLTSFIVINFLDSISCYTCVINVDIKVSGEKNREMLQRAARNAYSWWWASHIRTKQSKWLEDNLQDMEEKVDYILQIIDEDGDSFAQRAETYYRKRPELVNFMEDSFRRYRALAERYDHLSKELQSANRTIASVYPERVHLPMDDEDGEKFALAETSGHTSSKLSNNFPAVPRLSIPKVQTSSRKNAKIPSRLMSRKGLLKLNAVDAAATTPKSGLSKSEALKEIERLQKGILALQTEKEFVKSSYEIGLAKYWEIENQVTEMQAKVSSLQDDFGIGTYIEDDEARKLMTATALKSCQDTLAHLQQKQKQSAEEAILEFERIQEIRDKFKTLKEEFISNRAHEKGLIEEQKPLSLKLESENLEKQVETEKENSDLELLRAKIKEELQGSSGNSLTMSELAEKVDVLVDKTIKMECEISSQNACVRGLRLETNELQAHFQSLEEEKDSMIENADIKNNKIRELEEELCRVQTMMRCIRDQINNLQTHFTKTSCNLDDLSEKLLNVKRDEEAESPNSFGETKDATGAKPLQQFQVAEDLTSSDIILETCKDVNARETKEQTMLEEKLTSCSVENQKDLMQTRWSNQLADVSLDQQEREVSGATSEAGYLKEEMTIASSSKLVSPEDVKESTEVKKGSIADVDKVKVIQNMQSSQTKNHFDFQDNAAPGANSGNVFKETEDSLSPGHHVTKGIRKENEAKKLGFQDNSSFVRAEEGSRLQSPEKSNELNFLEAHERDAIDDSLKHVFKEGEVMTIPGNNSHILRSVRMKKQGNRDEVVIHSASPRYEERNIGSLNQENHLNDLLPNCPLGVSVHESLDKEFKELGETMIYPPQDSFEDVMVKITRKTFVNDYSFERQDTAPKTSGKQEDLMICGSELIMSTHMELKSDKKRENVPVHGTFGCAEEDHSGHNQLNDASRDIGVNDLADSDEGKLAEAQEDVMALCNISTLLTDTATEDLRREGKISGISVQSVRYNPFDDSAANVLEIDVEPTDRGNSSEAHEGIMALQNLSTLSKDTATEELRRKGKINESSGQSERYNPFNDVSGNAQGNDEAATDGGKGPKAHEGILALHDISTFSKDASTAEELTREGKNSGDSGQFESYNTFDDAAENVQENDVAGTATISRNTEIDEELRSDHSLDQGISQEAKDQDLFRKVHGDPYGEQAKFPVEEDDQPNWKELFLSGLDDREKILLQEYTSILRNYKEVKKKLNEVEKKKRASLFQYAIQIKLLRTTNAVKDSQIESLQKKLNCCQMDQGETPNSYRNMITDSSHITNVQSLDSDKKAIRDSLGRPTSEFMQMMEVSAAPGNTKISYVEEDEGDIEIINVDEPNTFSTIEEKIRMDIDELLEENIEFWLRFSTSFHQIQKFQNTVQDLQVELEKVKECKKQNENTNPSSLLSEIRPIYRHLREIQIQTELTLWLEHNAMLEDDLQNRLSSLSSLQEEIRRLSNAGSKMKESELGNYQAAKFQGEVLNMKQENNKVADELEAGLERVKNLQVEIQRTLASLDGELGISSTNQQTKNRTRIPLRAFLFGVKLKKRRPSIFTCVTPAMQKQYSDIKAVPT